MNEETGEAPVGKTEVDAHDKESTENHSDDKKNSKRSQHLLRDSVNTSDESDTEMTKEENPAKREPEKEHMKTKGNRNKDSGKSQDREKARSNESAKGDHDRNVENAKGDHELNKESAKKDKNEEKDQTHAFNLINPEQLSKQLEAANLDDEQTEELLHNAKKLNAKLRKILRQQQLGDDPSPPSRKSGSSPSRRHPEGIRASASRISGGGGRATSPKRLGERAGVGSAGKSRASTSTLPPIHAKSGQTRVKSAKSTTGSAKSRSGSRRSARPEWNDRFMFT